MRKHNNFDFAVVCVAQRMKLKNPERMKHPEWQRWGWDGKQKGSGSEKSQRRQEGCPMAVASPRRSKGHGVWPQGWERCRGTVRAEGPWEGRS